MTGIRDYWGEAIEASRERGIPLQSYLAGLYREGRDMSLDPAVREVAGHLSRAIGREYDRLPWSIEWTKDDPQGGYDRLLFEASLGRVRVFTGGSGSPIFGPATNLYFRAVHDWDHVVSGGDFSLTGEAIAYTVAVNRWPWAAEILFSEIVLQAAQSIDSGTFDVPQKVVIL